MRGGPNWCQRTKSLRDNPVRARPNRERSYQRRELLSLNQLCQRNCCGLRAEPCEITTLTRAGPRKLIASSRAPRRSFGSSTIEGDMAHRHLWKTTRNRVLARG